jgi:electron transfer flavoprotein alpha subunit
MSMRIVVVLHPWLASADERAALVAAAARLAPHAQVEALSFTRAADAAAIVGHLAGRLDAAAPTLLLAPAGAEGEQIAAGVAAAASGCGLGLCAGLTVEQDAVLAQRAVFGGRAELTVRCTAGLACAAIRPSAVAAGERRATVRHTEVALDAPAAFEAKPLPASHSHPRVEGAALVVSGGRGMGGPDGFALLARIAGALGAGLGGSLPAVDAGWVPVAHQVGQSGKFVAPRLYFAVGISGTPQHLAGISPDARIVALNSDRDAPIFTRCAIGVEGDWREILPRLAERLETARGGADTAAAGPH